MKNSKRRNASIYLISFAILLGLAIACYLFLAPRIRAYRKDMIGIRMMEKLGAGFNIGNDLDAYGVTAHKSAPTVEDFETYWHNVPATKELFAAIRAAGFSSVRIPVSWSEHTDADGTIDPAWMERVREVVDQALAEGLYVILDTHHELFIIPDKEHAQASEEGLRSLWRQIAPRFADCDEHLLFEGMNEPRMRDTDEEWTDGTSELRDVVNQLNAAFIETVREAGGNNATRFLLIPAYATSCKSRALEELEMPEDHRVLASVHAYLPHSSVHRCGQRERELARRDRRRYGGDPEAAGGSADILSGQAHRRGDYGIRL